MNRDQLRCPLFIIGSPRSGTSLLRLVMTSHSGIVIPPECGFITWLHDKYGDWRTGDNTGSGRLKLFINDLLNSKKMETWGLNASDIQTKIGIWQPRNYAELCAVVYATYAARIGKQFVIWGDKNNFYLNHLEELLGLYCDARFLHIVRDGRDVACSYREVMQSKSTSPYAPNLNTAIRDIALGWQADVTKIDTFLSVRPPNKAMTIRYEDLVKMPANTMRSVCAWLEISFEARMLDFYQQNRTNKLEPDLTLDWKKRTLQPISDDTVGRYVYTLSKSEDDEFQDLASEALVRFSYPTK